MSEIFKKAKNHFAKKLPFAVYCKPNSNKIIALFQKNDTLFSLDNSEISGFAFASFDGKSNQIIPENESDIYFELYNQSDFYLVNSDASFAEELIISEKNIFENLVAKAIDKIKYGAFEKVVVSRKIELKIDGLDIELIFNKLLFHYPSALKSVFYHPQIGLWIGASPEQLFKIENEILNTVSLAGTQLFEKNKIPVWHQKEQQEQQIVTDFITQKLQSIANNVTVSKPYSHKAGNLIHLKTDLEAKLKPDFSVFEISKILHPTPAVCGFPKSDAQRFILENEDYDRQFYSGFLGEWNKDLSTFTKHNTDLFVNLRCMKIEKNIVSIYAGCGVTKDSNPEKEFLETQNKMKTILAVL